MLRRTRWIVLLALGGALLLGGPSAAFAQGTGASPLEVDSLAAEMELDAEGRAQLEEIGALMGRMTALRRRVMEARSEMKDAMQTLHERLSPEARKELMRAMHRTMRSAHGGRREERAGHGGRGNEGPGMHADSAMHGEQSGHSGSGSEAHGHHGAGHGSGEMHGEGPGMQRPCPMMGGHGDAAARDTTS